MTSPSHRVRMLAACIVALVALHVHSAQAQGVPQLVAPCMGCHPTSGAPPPSIGPIPIIWGQNEGYVYLQLRDFKSSSRASEAAAVMHALTQSMSEADMLSVAKYVSVQPWPKLENKTTAPIDPLLGRGALVTAYGDCGGCHFNNLQGYSAAPRLRGQTTAYLTTTIDEFRRGKRANSPGMADLLQVYSAEDIAAMVTYFSSLE